MERASSHLFSHPLGGSYYEKATSVLASGFLVERLISVATDLEMSGMHPQQLSK